MITQREMEDLSKQVAAAEALADRLSQSGQHEVAGEVMALRQSLRAIVTKDIATTSILQETDEVLTALMVL